MAELLLELLSEEIPARMQARAADDLKGAVLGALGEADVTVGAARAYATPRRLAVVVDDVGLGQPDRTIERRGPRVDAPAAARDGFLKSLGEADYRLVEREDRKGRVLVATWHERGRPSREIIAEAMPEILARFPWPKSMRWGSGEVRWVRPLRSILCLLDGEVVTFSFAGIESCATTLGHSFMSPEVIEAASFADYEAKLEAAKVILDPVIRRRMIIDGAEQLAAGQALRVRDDPGLLDELAGLVEWPVPLLGRIDPDSMRLPPEVLTTSMRTHQRYLALEDGEGQLAPWFVAVANIEAPDGGAAITVGNERVLRARLWDARFFWEQDRKYTLESRLPVLDATIFHEKLGSIGDKVRRLMTLAPEIAKHVPGADPELVQRAAELSKADLKTGMVGEFPELQGIVGGYYVLFGGGDAAVAYAVSEQYLPKGPSDRCPVAPNSIAMALAEKLDTLVGFFAVGIKPTGSGDPFALRRAALGVIRLVVENKLRLPLRKAIRDTLNAGDFRQRFADTERRTTTADLLAFFADRIKVYLRERGVRHDHVAAVFATGDDDLVRIIARVDALASFLGSDDGRDLLAGYRRASSIVAIEEKRDGRAVDGEPDPALLVDGEEVALHAALTRAQARIKEALANEDYGTAMAAVAALRAPIDAFFEAVMVNAPEPERRVNRLRLLGMIRSALGSVADFGLIEDAGDERAGARR